MSNTYDKIYEVVKQIPRGKVCTYGAIAEYLGSKGGARIVGWAMNQCHSVDASIPAHRVVNRNGLLTGKHHFPGEKTMQELLENEGLVIIDNQIQNLEKHLWNPNI